MSLRLYVLVLFVRVLSISWIALFVRDVIRILILFKKISNFSYHWVVVSECDPFLVFGKCIFWEGCKDIY
jgi:hypothetical protein